MSKTKNKKLNEEFDPFENLVLDKEEQFWEDALKDGLQPVPKKELEKTKKLLKQAAINTIVIRSKKPITIRLDEMDVFALKKIANAKNIPYQTLIGVLIRQYVEGKLKVEL